MTDCIGLDCTRKHAHGKRWWTELPWKQAREYGFKSGEVRRRRVAHRDRRIVEMAKLGWTQGRIAAECARRGLGGLTRQRVSQVLKRDWGASEPSPLPALPRSRKRQWKRSRLSPEGRKRGRFACTPERTAGLRRRPASSDGMNAYRQRRDDGMLGRVTRVRDAQADDVYDAWGKYGAVQS